MQRAKSLVTRDSLKLMLLSADNVKQMRIIGRALSAIYKNQTNDERNAANTTADNGVGFTKWDAAGGCEAAKQYIETCYLHRFYVDKWLVLTPSGYPRICKYAKQLNQSALAKNQVSLHKLAELRAKYAAEIHNKSSDFDLIVQQMRAIEQQLSINKFEIIC